jgi:predicted small secreted protein
VRKLRFKNLNDAVKELKVLNKAKDYKIVGKWTYYQILDHCSADIEGSILGYKRKVPWLFRKFFGPSVLKKILKNGFIPARQRYPAILKKREKANERSALNRILKAIKNFKKYNGPMFDDPFYGCMNKEQYEKLHAYHLAHHLGFVEPNY